METSRPSEMTIRGFLLKELQQRGVKVTSEISYTTPIGRLMPDMLLRNGAQYVVETKLGAEAKLLDAMVRLYDYSKYTSTQGAFAVLFPRELRQAWDIQILDSIAKDPKLEYVATAIFKDFRPSQRFVGNLFELADWISAQVLRPLAVEADTGFAIKVLTEAVESMTATMKKLGGKQLEEIFGGRTVFQNILQFEEGRYPLEEMRQATTYLLVNQIIFYYVLSCTDVTFKSIDEDTISKPGDLQDYFRPVLKRNYSSVFGFDVASKLPASATVTLKKVIVAVKALAPEKIGHDVLGKVFHELIPFNTRKAVAAFYTNNEAAELLAQLAIDKGDAQVIDLAVGSGTLLVAAYRRKRDLLKKTKGSFQLPEDHKKFLENDLTGIDIMPFAAHLAVAHLSLQALLSETDKVRVAVWDSTELKPGQTIPAIRSELRAAYRRPTLDMFEKGSLPQEAYLTKGTATLEGLGGESIHLEEVDVVMMNPPFTRQERLPKDYKYALNKRLGDQKGKLHGRLGLHGYFILLADRFLRPGGRLALLLPATILRLESAKGIRKLLAEDYSIEHIITTRQRAAFSEGAQFREILLVAKKNEKSKGRSSQDEQCTVTFVKKLPSDLKDARRIAYRISKTFGDFEDDDVVIHKHDLQVLRSDLSNWFDLIATENKLLIETWRHIRRKGNGRLTTLNGLIEKENGSFQESVRSRKGGDMPFLFICRTEDRAIKKHDIWITRKESSRRMTIVHRFLGTEFSIPKSSIVPGLRRASGVKHMDITSSLDSLIVRKFSGIDDFLVSSPRHMEKKSIERWREYVLKRIANVAPLRRFDLSASGTSLLAFYSSENICPGPVLWSIYLPDDEVARILTFWLNSSVNLLQILLNRSETRGAFIELGKYMLEAFLVLDPNHLRKNERRAILNTFNKQKKVTFMDLLEQLEISFEARKCIDRTLLKTLGLDEEEISVLLTRLYPALHEEILRLKDLMAG